MKAATSILFTILYVVFFSFAVTGYTASSCGDNTCRNAVFPYQERSEINTDNSHDDCTHKPVVTAHVVQKQVNNIDGGGNKYSLLGKWVEQNNIGSKLMAIDTHELCSDDIAPTTCPLFIKHCVLLI